MAINKLKIVSYLLLFISGILITSCQPKDEVNTDTINIDFKFSRFEKELFDKENTMDIKVPQLVGKYGVFFTRFCDNIIKIDNQNQAAINGSLKNFIYDSDIANIYKETLAKYSDMSVEQQELKLGFKRYNYYFPEKAIPQIATFISGFNYAVVATDSVLGIGLDMYMGQDYKYYEMIRFPQYRRKRMERQYLVKDAFKGWLQSEFEKENTDKTFLNDIIHEGKLTYVLHRLLPETKKEVLFGYSNEQYNWCLENEANMWTFFVSEKLFYSTTIKDYHKFVNEAPFTKDFDRQSPDQTGYYMGYKIVEAYMKNNPKVTPSQLLEIKDPKVILNKSGYKPLK